MNVAGWALCWLLSGAADELVAVRAPPLRLKVPAAWTAKTVEGSRRYDAPSKDAYFLLDVGHTARPMSGEECRTKILSGLGATDAVKLSIGNAPAAKHVAYDKSADGKSEVHTHTFVGCDGTTTWSLVFHFDARRAQRFSALAEQIAQSIEYR